MKNISIVQINGINIILILSIYSIEFCWKLFSLFLTREMKIISAEINIISQYMFKIIMKNVLKLSKLCVFISRKQL